MAWSSFSLMQSTVCMKQLAFELLELLLLATFPELDDVIRRFHEEKEQFGGVEENRWRFRSIYVTATVTFLLWGYKFACYPWLSWNPYTRR